jgi:hypothetical protein
MGFDDAPEMLCLAALTYRRFDETALPQLDARRLDAAVRRGLLDVGPLAGRWELVWGPAAWRAPFSLFDDAAMFVVRSLRPPRRYVVAIRGTNPLSGFDWVFGDLWVGRQLAWPYGDGKISFSTALGLAVLQSLRSPAPESGLASEVWRFIDDELARAGNRVFDLIEPLLGAIGQRLLDARRSLWRALTELRERRLARAPADHAACLEQLTAEWAPDATARLIGLIDDAIVAAGGDRQADLLSLLETEAALGARTRPGHDLLTFLRGAVGVAEGPVEVVVTGHSKGGALADAVALWLADTQGEAWDPGCQATVRCLAFAGPTAGNAAFARHWEATLADRGLRIANPLDVVTHAWEPDALCEIPDLYRGHVVPVGALRSLAETIAAAVAPLGYRHAGVCWPGFTAAVDETRPDFFAQLVHQHLDAYLAALGLAPLIGTWTFFDPLG